MCGGFISGKKKTNNGEELLRAGDWDTVDSKQLEIREGWVRFSSGQSKAINRKIEHLTPYS